MSMTSPSGPQPERSQLGEPQPEKTKLDSPQLTASPGDSALDGSACPATWVLQQAKQLGLPVLAEDALCQNWALLAAIAAPLMAEPLPQELDPAPRFEP